MPENVWTVTADRRSQLYCGCRCRHTAAVYARHSNGIFCCHHDNSERICGGYGTDPSSKADHNPHVRDVSVFPDSRGGMERDWGRHADARRPFWRWQSRHDPGIPHGSHDDMLGKDRGRTFCRCPYQRFGRPVKRTNICKLGFHVQDVILLLICIGAFAAQIYVLVARG